MSSETVFLGDIMVKKQKSIDPKKHPEATFALYSIPGFDAGAPEICDGVAIGSTKKCLEPGDVILSRIIPHIRRAWVVGNHDVGHIVGSSEWIVFRSPDFHSPYLRHILTADPFHAQFMNTVAGVGGSLVRARPKAAAQIEISLPSLKEQRRIAGILDAADALRRRRREALALLDTIPGAIFAEMFGDYKNDRHSWETVSFSDACIDRTSRSPKVKARDYCSIGKLPVVDQGAALIAGFVDNLDMENVSPLPVVIFGDHTRHVKLVDFPFATGADGAKVLEPGNGFIAEYLAECIRALPLPDLGYSRHMRELKRLEFPKPPVDQQMTFARQVACINEQRNQYERDIQELETLFASLQSRAFAGEL